MLPLYDTGVGSLYDLRHVSLHGAPNVARWDYHAVHIFQLHWLYIIEGDELFKETANRWIRFSEDTLQTRSRRVFVKIFIAFFLFAHSSFTSKIICTLLLSDSFTSNDILLC
ncbi:D-glucuronyl C5-epimerase [Trichinella spiralis]|uniref:D-glucuronyl C5-epimerase n=1 Tax=Trichinella spiralis TaxID=6334 RepID=A0ABR3KXI5_TRISP